MGDGGDISDACDAKVDDLDEAVLIEDEVFELEIAVDEREGLVFFAGELVGVIESFASIGDQLGSQGPREGFLSFLEVYLEQRIEIDAAHKFHGDVDAVFGASDIVDLDDVRMLKTRSKTRLMQQHPPLFGACLIVEMDAFQHDFFGKVSQADLNGAPNLGLSPLSQAGDQLVFPITYKDARSEFHEISFPLKRTRFLAIRR